MKLTFLGTAAAEGVPAVFCNCACCKRARSRGGRDIRTRSQILIDGDTLFDFPMDSYMHALEYGLDLSAVKRVLITHSHMDHCYPQEFCLRGGPFAHGMTEKAVTIYGNATVCEMFMSDVKRELRDDVAAGLFTRVLRPFDEITDGDIRIIAVPAVHTVGEDCLVYYVERDGVGALLMNDTGILERAVFERIKGMGVNVRVAALDSTYGSTRHGKGRHMGLYDVADQRALLLDTGLIDEDATVIATHISHNSDPGYAELCALAAPLGISVAYDGMAVEVK